jgi:hypothetical protein
MMVHFIEMVVEKEAPKPEARFFLQFLFDEARHRRYNTRFPVVGVRIHAPMRVAAIGQVPSPHGYLATLR